MTNYLAPKDTGFVKMTWSPFSLAPCFLALVLFVRGGQEGRPWQQQGRRQGPTASLSFLQNPQYVYYGHNVKRVYENPTKTRWKRPGTFLIHINIIPTLS